MKTALLALALVLPATSAWATRVSGHNALALAVLMGNAAPALPGASRITLLHLMEGQLDGAGSKKGAISVTADAVVCRAGDIDITAFSCELTFGSTKKTLSGRPAHELFATLAEVGTPIEGAAGSAFAALHTLSCTVVPSAVAEKSGGGADCSFEAGPP